MNPLLIILLCCMILLSCKKDNPKPPLENQITGQTVLTLMDTSNSKPISNGWLFIEERNPLNGYLVTKEEYQSDQYGQVFFSQSTNTEYYISIAHADYLLKQFTTEYLTDTLWLKPYIQFPLHIINNFDQTIEIWGGFNESPIHILKQSDTLLNISHPIYTDLSLAYRNLQGNENQKSFWVESSIDTLNLIIK